MQYVDILPPVYSPLQLQQDRLYSCAFKSAKTELMYQYIMIIRG
jgi:hypothetical protein